MWLFHLNVGMRHALRQHTHTMMRIHTNVHINVEVVYIYSYIGITVFAERDGQSVI